MTYIIKNTTNVFQGKVFNVRVDEVVFPNGSSQRIDIVEHHGAVALVPLDEDQYVWLVQQYRHPAGKTLLEIPAGTLKPGEKPEDCARRECREELGLAPEKLIPLGGVFLAPGYSTEFLHFYLAKDLYPDPLPADENEVLEPIKLPWKDIESAMEKGKIADAKTLAGFALAKSYILDS